MIAEAWPAVPEDGDAPQDHGLAGALDLTHLLQLGVDGVQC